MPDEHWSLPGQQGKFALARRDDRWYEARGSAATKNWDKTAAALGLSV
jgi:serine/threonine-protein kinase HipA